MDNDDDDRQYTLYLSCLVYVLTYWKLIKEQTRFGEQQGAAVVLCRMEV